MSSAKDNKFNFDFNVIYVYISNKIGPIMDSCGTPHVISAYSDLILYLQVAPEPIISYFPSFLKD